MCASGDVFEDYSYWPRCVRAARSGALEFSLSPLKAVRISRTKKIAPDVSIADESSRVMFYWDDRREMKVRPASASFIAGIKSVSMSTFST